VAQLFHVEDFFHHCEAFAWLAVAEFQWLESFGAGGSFTEYYAVDFNDDVILMGHDGPGHIAIAEGKIKVRPLHVYHGKVGRGLSVEMSVKHGPVTLLSVAQTIDGKL
jgi:L-arabinose isomerase